jgi:hypothetical protein
MAMTQGIRRLHRALVYRLADSRALRGRVGAHAHWWHYEQHARASARARRLHAAGRAEPRVLRGLQARVARLHAAGRAGSDAERRAG